MENEQTKMNENIKYNSVENAEQFLNDQIEFALKNHIDFSVWSNGVELQAIPDTNELMPILDRAELKNKGYWRAFRMVDGKQVSVML